MLPNFTIKYVDTIHLKQIPIILQFEIISKMISRKAEYLQTSNHIVYAIFHLKESKQKQYPHCETDIVYIFTKEMNVIHDCMVIQANSK